MEGGCGMETLIFHLFFKVSGVPEGGNIDFSWFGGVLRAGDVDFSLFFQAFWCAGGMDGDIDFKFVF